MRTGTCFEILGIDATKDVRTIRHQYAKLAGACNAEGNPEEFRQLKEAYDQAMQYARGSEEMDELVSDNNQKESMDGLFYSTTSMDAIYEKNKIEKYRQMYQIAGLFKQLETIGNQGETQTSEVVKYLSNLRDYVRTEEFLENQFEGIYIKVIVQLLELSNQILPPMKQKECRSVIAIMYHVPQYCREPELELLLSPLYELLGEDISDEVYLRMLKNKEYKELAIAQNLYIPLSLYYIAKSNPYGKGIWPYFVKSMADMNYHKALSENTTSSLAIMVCSLIHNHREITEEDFYSYIKEVEEVRKLHLPFLEKKVFVPISQSIQAVTGMDYSSRDTLLNTMKTPKDYITVLKLTAGNCWDDRLVKRAFMQEEFMKVRGDAEFTKAMKEYLENNEVFFETFEYIYRSYLHIPEKNQEESEFLAFLERNVTYVKKYWDDVKKRHPKIVYNPDDDEDFDDEDEYDEDDDWIDDEDE